MWIIHLMLDILMMYDSSTPLMIYGNLCYSLNNVGGSIGSTVQYSSATLEITCLIT